MPRLEIHGSIDKRLFIYKDTQLEGKYMSTVDNDGHMEGYLS